MADDISFLHAILTGASMSVTGVFAFFAKRFVTKVDETADRLTKHEKEDVGKYATVDQLTRVHSRIDDVQKSMSVGFGKTQDSLDGIRNILINGAHQR